ncbi:MAG: FkbM family methyltransferase [Alphaproteobacteria bacterium]|nr:FkbM family methyltransferase [Alphaproteobacteria bacterium]
MATRDIVYNPVLPYSFRNIGNFGLPDFMFLDIGASGGVEQHWLSLGDKFNAIGFDVIVEEVARLNSINQNPRIKYENYFVGFEGYEELLSQKLFADPIASRTNDPQKRTSYERAWKAMNINYTDTYFNNNQKTTLTDKRISIDAYVEQHGIKDVDFIKIDTDGHDYEVLLGAEKTLKSSVLGASIEVPFHGPAHPHANVFCNIDRFMRDLGFSLYVLDSYPCSKGALPAQFTYKLPAQTIKGQIQWGDAIYFRDGGDITYSDKWKFDFDRTRLHKLCCLFEIAGLGDCAAEVLLHLRDTTEFKYEYNAMLDLLTRGFAQSLLSYDNYIKAFDTDPTRLYPK